MHLHPENVVSEPCYRIFYWGWNISVYVCFQLDSCINFYAFMIPDEASISDLFRC